MKRSSNGFHVAAACSIAAVVATVVPAIFGTAPDATGVFKHLGDPWHDFVFNYQTLLTGVAAVAAAFFTIHQMTLIDQQSERRHQELLALSHRVDHLRLERALNPQYSDLVQISQAFLAKQLDRPIFEGKNADERHATWLSAELLPHVEEIIKVIGRKQFRDGAVLFGGVLSARLLVLNEAVKALQPRLSYHRNIVDEPYESEEQYEDYRHYIFDEFRDEKGTIFSQMAALTDVLPLVIREVEKLAKELEVRIGIVDHDGSITPLQRRA
ncbi:hypothetical protein [Rhizobium mongolense]|uniref:Uncharacterized protein n=1 Tax=Rhizobium mongolense TaxID=57676 RepID=A0A7W6WDS4_9HYPH|nr:hypothetical protein [Rhizobium mongolense]MBB4274100.1 hypothetical protein [Rhizobium mongolense]